MAGKKKLWFSITARDCEWKAKRGKGKGGQKKNKTSSAIQCFHRPSGARGDAEDTRKQTQNRRLAFKRMADTEEFQGWLKLKIEAGRGNIQIEFGKSDGTWEDPRKVGLNDV